jgi:hypothetical protein
MNRQNEPATLNKRTSRAGVPPGSESLNSGFGRGSAPSLYPRDLPKVADKL